ncbi:four-carbon acid sugar kinase family protein [Streptomyces sp. Q6]|uniref:Four-carbon acid sugar kinase family protein n=1 Tax=Streptomyces citrinus TaxID=3118173 RepID=A0ACD5A668_9ACTN
MRVAILADDLTSAGDGAAPFGAARVVVAPPHAPPPATDGVLAVDLATRTASVAVAASRTERAARLLRGADLLMKTVDSTLRGHLAAETEAARRGSGRGTVIVAPAFPAGRRGTVDGIQYVGDVPVHLSEFGRDPVHPVRSANLREVLPGAVLVARGEVPDREAGGVFVCDAVTDADLDRLVAAAPHPGDALWVGSPGSRRHSPVGGRLAPRRPCRCRPSPPRSSSSAAPTRPRAVSSPRSARPPRTSAWCTPRTTGGIRAACCRGSPSRSAPTSPAARPTLSC